MDRNYLSITAFQILAFAFGILWAPEKRFTFSLQSLFAVVLMAAVVCTIYQAVSGPTAMPMVNSLLCTVGAIFCHQRDGKHNRALLCGAVMFGMVAIDAAWNETRP